MTEEFSKTAVRQFAIDIASLTGEMNVLARSAITYCESGFDDRAMNRLHDVEPLLFDAKTLLLASSLLRRLASKGARRDS